MTTCLSVANLYLAKTKFFLDEFLTFFMDIQEKTLHLWIIQIQWWTHTHELLEWILRSIVVSVNPYGDYREDYEMSADLVEAHNLYRSYTV